MSMYTVVFSMFTTVAYTAMCLKSRPIYFFKWMQTLQITPQANKMHRNSQTYTVRLSVYVTQETVSIFSSDFFCLLGKNKLKNNNNQLSTHILLSNAHQLLMMTYGWLSTEHTFKQLSIWHHYLLFSFEHAFQPGKVSFKTNSKLNKSSLLSVLHTCQDCIKLITDNKN